MRSRTTFKKRQKELARQEKQRDKAARRLERKLHKNAPESGEAPGDETEDQAGEDTDVFPAEHAAADAHHSADAQ